ncbi:MAG: TonB-dependent receptor [Microscillaceae bacterium]|nr:TonB-dependent receptor [Microscillaceae bacterium]MDW8461472.1 TonB-dependent receptor [Cytophagales bacterium]
MKSLYVCCFRLAVAIHLWDFTLCSAQKITLSGYVKDAQTREDLVGAAIFWAEKNIGTNSNAYGFYSLALPITSDTIYLKISLLGYENQKIAIPVNASNITQNIYLVPLKTTLEEVIISANSLEEKTNRTQMSLETLSAKELKTIPAIFGELDPLKALQLKPGIKSGGEGFSGLYVRGGGPDQNLVLLDETLVYNPVHLFGFFSIFNPDAVKNVELYKGDFPAQFGGRLSSVVDVKMNEGNKQKPAATGGIGLISSRLTLEAPIQKGKGSVLLSGRRTYADIFTRMLNRANEGVKNYTPIPDYYFYDANFKANYEINEKNRIFLSAYYGRDIFKFQRTSTNIRFNWGNTALSLRWNMVISPKIFANFSATFSDYNYQITNQFNDLRFEAGSGIRDYSLKADFDFTLNPKHTIRWGYQHTFHTFLINRISANSQERGINFNTRNELYGQELGVYVQEDPQINKNLRLSAGLRASGFLYKEQFYAGIEPRVALRYKLDEKNTLKSSFARMYQYVHLVSNSGASLPTDIWYPATNFVQPQLSDQVAVGYSRLLFDGKILFTNEYYYKNMQNQIDLRDGARLFGNDNLEEELVFGRGWSYGTEFYLEKKEGKTTGWIGYALSWVYRQFPDIDNGKPFFPRYDRRHDVACVVMHEVSPRILLSGAWVYGTGNAFSLPTGRFLLQNIPGANPIIVPEFLQRNGFRLPATHRLDISLIWKLKPKRLREADFTFSLYNAYNRRNAFFIYFEELKDEQTNQTIGFRARQVTLFPIIPSITYNFKF